MRLVYYTFIPVIIFRTYGAVMYRKRDNLDFKDLAQNIEIFYHAGYGMWTLLSLYHYMHVSQNCRELLVMSMINFEITMILGCWSSVHVIMVGIVILVLVPILIYQAWHQHR